MGIISKIWKSKAWLPITIILLAVVNWAASLYHSRIDLTNEKRFTLSSATKKILKKLDDVVEVDVFLKGEFPSGFKKLANSTDEVLQEFKEVTGNNFQYNFISPDDEIEGTNVKWGDTLSSLGLYPINLKSQLKAGEQQQLLYPIALVHYKGRTLPLRVYNGSPLISHKEINSAEALLEFGFADAIHKISQHEKPMIAYAIGNGEPTLYSDIETFSNPHTYDLTYSLRRDYRVFNFNLKTQPLIPDTFKLLMIVKPTMAFGAEEKLKIDQFVMRGGKLVMFIDRLNAEMDSLQIKNEVIAYDRDLQLDDLLFKYGARINSDLVMDIQSDRLPFDVNGNGQFEFLKWNYFPFFAGRAGNPVSKAVGFVSGKFVNSIDTVAAEGIKKSILLSTSPNGKRIATPALITGRENQIAPDDSSFHVADIPVAVLLEGKFQSLFSNRLSQQMSDSLEKYGAMFVQQNITDNKMIIVADGDMVLNGMRKDQPIPMGMNEFTVGSQYEMQVANRDFLENSLDYLINPSGLKEARAKEYTLRLLDKKKTDEQRTMWQLINIVVPVILFTLFAFIFLALRRRKYTKPYHE